MSASLNDLLAILPFLCCACGALIVILCDALTPPRFSRTFLGGVALVALLLTAISAFNQTGMAAYSAFSNLVAADGVAGYLGLIIALATALAVMATMAKPREGAIRGEFYALLLIAAAGALLTVQATDFVALFIALECLSIPAYVLAAALRRDARSLEAGLKYFILGAFSTGCLVYGIALVYGACGSTHFADIAQALATGRVLPSNLLLLSGTAFLIVGLGFKAALVPFHMWAPDVYQGAPTPATTFFATTVKCAAFGALARVFLMALPALGPLAGGHLFAMQVLAVATMTIANLTALAQDDVKRMLAYSSIAHTGYLLLGILAGSDGGAALMFYLGAYSFMTAGAFMLVAYFEHDGGGTRYADYAGIAHRSKVTAALMALFMFSLAGIPPTAGFFAKFYLFAAVVGHGMIPLAVIAVINSLVSAAYYLRLIVVMYMTPRETATEGAMPVRPFFLLLAVGACALVVLFLGVCPAPYIAAARDAAAQAFHTGL